MAKGGLYHYSTGFQDHTYVCWEARQRGFPLLSKFYLRGQGGVTFKTLALRA